MVGGSDLVSGAHDLGCLLIHHIWLTENESNSLPPKKFDAYVDSWGEKTPGAVCVLWRDRDARALVECMGRSDFFYGQLVAPVERADYLRMLVMSKFGGVYVDVDMQALQDVRPHIDASKAVNLVLSPLFTEAFQTCILVANEVGHPLWLDVAAQIEDNVHGMNNSSAMRFLFTNRLFGRIARMAMTVFLTGPSNVDKCIAMASVCGGYGGESIAILKPGLYRGPIAKHHEAGSWTMFPRVFAMGDMAAKALQWACHAAKVVQSWKWFVCIWLAVMAAIK